MSNIIISYVGVWISYFIISICYKKISNYEFNIYSFKKVSVLSLISILGYFNNSMNYNITRAVVHLLVLTLMFLLMFNEDIKRTFIKTLLIYIIICLFELILSFLIVSIKSSYVYDMQENVFVKVYFSTIVMLFTLLFFDFKKILSNTKNFIETMLNKKNLIISIFFGVFFIAVLLLTFKFAINLTFNVYINNILILTIVLLFFVFFIIQYIKLKKAEAKEEILLDFMSKYEKILDNDRINRHEILNNLLILKSFENKNSKKYEETLNSIIKEYESKDKNIFINLYNLPTGLKGLLYYKVYEMKNSNINVFLNISNKVLPKLEKMESKDFMKLCRVLGILLDNSKEAAENSDSKNIVIDVYKENKKVVVYIENTTKNKVEINKIYEKNYSTKGRNRGLGLFIAKDIIRNSTIFELEQCINETNNFVSILTII